MTLFFCKPSNGQSIESIFPDVANCTEIDLLALDAIPRFYERQELDSIELILDFVAQKCIETPTLRLTRFLLLIEQHRFSDTLLSPLDLFYIKKESVYLQKGHLYEFSFLEKSMQSETPANIGNVIWRKNTIERNYLDLLAKWTNTLAARNDNDKLESAVISHLQSYDSEQTSPGLWGLSAKKNGYLSLPSTYNKYHRDYIILRSWQVTVGGGTFISTGDMRPLMGSRTNLMFSIGKNFGHPKNRIDFGGTFTFGSTRKNYQVVTPDTSFITNEGYASFAYLDFVRNLWRPNRFFEWNVSLGGGIAEKGIYKALTEDDTVENEPAERTNNAMGPAFIVKPAAFAGSEFKIFVASGVAFNLQARYCLFDWGNVGGTSLSGNVITMNAGLTFHFGGHPASAGMNIFDGL